MHNVSFDRLFVNMTQTKNESTLVSNNRPRI